MPGTLHIARAGPSARPGHPSDERPGCESTAHRVDRSRSTRWPRRIDPSASPRASIAAPDHHGRRGRGNDVREGFVRSAVRPGADVFAGSDDETTGTSHYHLPHGAPQGSPRDRRPRGHHQQPGQGLLPRARPHQARSGALLRRRRRRGAGRGSRPPDGAQAVRRRDRCRAVLPEAGARQPSRLDAGGDAHLPVRANRGRDRGRRGGRPGLGRQPRLHRPQPPPGAGRGSRPSRRAARRPRPGARRALVADPRGRAGVPRGARRRGAGRLAQDVGLARDPHQRPHRAPLDVSAGPAGRAGPGPGCRAAGALDRHLQVVEGGAPRGVPRLQPERQGPDGRVGVLGAAAARCPGLVPPALGRGGRRGRRGLHARDRARAVPRAGRRGRRHRRCGRLARGAPRALRPPRGRGPGRRALAAQLRQAGRRAAARPAVPQAARRKPSTPGVASTAVRRPRSRRPGPRRSRPATGTPACRPTGRGHAPRPPAADGRPSR